MKPLTPAMRSALRNISDGLPPGYGKDDVTHRVVMTLKKMGLIEQSPLGWIVTPAGAAANLEQTEDPEP